MLLLLESVLSFGERLDPQGIVKNILHTWNLLLFCVLLPHLPKEDPDFIQNSRVIKRLQFLSNYDHALTFLGLHNLGLLYIVLGTSTRPQKQAQQ